MSDLVSAISSTVNRHKNKQKITVNFRLKHDIFFDISGGVSHRTGRYDMMITDFFVLILLHFFFSSSFQQSIVIVFGS